MFDKEIAYRIIEAGILAPSGDNLQPWRFKWDGSSIIDIYIDPGIDNSLYNIEYDMQRIASLISLGAVVDNMRVRASYLGIGIKLNYLPSPKDKSFSARITLIEERDAGQQETSSLDQYIPKRCVNRKVYYAKEIDKEIQDKIIKEAKKYEDIKLYWLEDKKKIKKLAGLVSMADKIMFETEGLLLPLMKSIRWTRKEEETTMDGMPLKSLELGWFDAKGFRLFSCWRLVKFLNYFGLGWIASRHSVRLMESSAAACLLTVIFKEDDVKDFIRGGELLERIWLLLASFDISAQPMAGLAFLINRVKLLKGQGFSRIHIEDINAMKEILYPIFNLKEEEIPLILLRLGHSSAPSSRTRRHRIEDLLIQ